MKKLLTIILLSSIIHAADNNSLLEWTTKTAMETFNYNALNFQTKLSSLQSKFTTEGWQRYKQALNESGNVDYVVTNNLIVTGHTNGDATISELTSDQWEVVIPTIVLYLNEYMTITQDLTTHVVVEKTNEGTYAISDINSKLNTPILVNKASPYIPNSCKIS